MDCPKCRNSEVDASGTCLICGFQVPARDPERKVRFRQRRREGGSAASLAYDSIESPAENPELPEWRRDLARRLQEIRQKRDASVEVLPAAPAPAPVPLAAGPEPSPPPSEVLLPERGRAEPVMSEPAPPEPVRSEAAAPPPQSRQPAIPERRAAYPPRSAPAIARRPVGQRAGPRAAAPPPQDPLPFPPIAARLSAPAGVPVSARQRATPPAADAGSGIENMIDRIVARQTPVAPTIPDAPHPPPAPHPDLPLERDRLILLSRTLAGLIDLVIVFLCGTSFVLAAELVSGIVVFDARSWIHYSLLLVAIFFVYSVFFLGASGQTIGMMITDLKVVTLERGRPSVLAIVGRSALFLVALVPLGAGLIAGIFDPATRCLHDRRSGTEVVRVAWPEEIETED